MYEISALFWYRAIFTVELLAAEGMLVTGLKPRSMPYLRIPAAIIACIGFSFAVPIVSYDAVWCSVMFLAMFLFSVLALKFCFSESWGKIFFFAVAAYTIQHISYQAFDISMIIIGNSAREVSGGFMYGVQMPSVFYGSGGAIALNPFYIMVYLYEYGMLYFFGRLFVRSRLKKAGGFNLGHVKMLIIAVIILFFDIVLSSVITYYSQDTFDSTYCIVVDLYNIFCCLFTLYLQFVVNRSSKTESDLVYMRHLWEEKERQLAASKENIELINQKVHDLKHQIRTIGGNSSLDGDVIREITETISIYDSPVKSGNEALDIILTEKSLYCSRHGIKLCCIIDGEKLGFITLGDLYALFGNIIDNAIEAVSQLDEGKRVISLSVKEIKSFLTINIYNYYSGSLEFDGVVPKTTKSDSATHGYGMKSVLMLCKKYGGELEITSDNNIFNLNMIFPTATQTATQSQSL